MRSLLCETATGDTMAQLLAARDAAGRADMVEVRLDGVKDLDVERALHGRRGAVIATCRPRWEGGRFDGDEEARGGLLRRAVDAGAEYVDIEWKALRHEQGLLDQLVRENRERVVISSHYFNGLPGDVCAEARAMRAFGAAVIKIAVTVPRLSDSLPLREVAKGGDAVVIGMGDAGVPSRLLATRFGSRWTYGGHAVAPGQLPVSRMIDEFRFLSITDRTSVYGVAGEAALASAIPATHNAAFAAAGKDAVCVPLPAADEADIATFAVALGIIGWERCT